MSAADEREKLEAAIWPRVTPGQHEHGKDASRRAVDAILAAADRYATAKATEHVIRAVTGAPPGTPTAQLPEIRIGEPS